MRTLLIICLFFLTDQHVFCQTFTLKVELPKGLRSGSFSWGDINNDGNLDFIQTGNDINGIAATRLYLNSGTSFDLQETDLPDIFEGASDWGDYDNDGDVDLLLAGNITDRLITSLYDNIDGILKLNDSVSFHGIDRGSVEWGDYDKDGDLDILLSGQDSGSNSITKIYTNENGTFTETSTTIPGVSFGVATWVDFDGDGDLDVMISGVTGTAPDTGPKVTKLYKNTGTSFSLVFKDSFEGLSDSTLDFGDYDNDGDLDLLLAGFTNSNTAFTAIYKNNGATFDIIFDDSLPDVIDGQVLWGDSDNDGDLDAFISGNIITGDERIAKLYTNTGSGFELEFNFKEAGQSTAEFGDYDNDGDIDLFIAGQRNDFTIYSSVYQNNNTNKTFANNANTLPATPVNLTSQIGDEEILFNWKRASDNNTLQSALTYALYLRSESKILVNASAISNGKRKLVKRGNSGTTNSFSLNRILEPGDYFWSVQTIDNSFDGSPFATEVSFHINFPPVIVGTASIISTPEETPLTIEIQDLVLNDPDNEFPKDFTLVVLDGNNYSVSNNKINPDLNFNGTLAVPVQVNDGTDYSEIVEISIEVTPVNDRPVITGSSVSYSTPEETSLTIKTNNIIIIDPDNEFPADFTLAVLNGDNYTVSNNEITPDDDFVGVLEVSITVNDGTDTSEPFTLMIEVTKVVGIDSHFIQGNFSLFPNPVKDYLNILPSDASIPYKLEIYSLNGLSIGSNYEASGDFKIDLSACKKGTYFLRIIRADKVGTMLIMKN